MRDNHRAIAAIDTYRASLQRVEPLDAATELVLAKRWAEGDQDAGRRLVEANLPFVIRIAREYRRWGVPLEDLIQQGNLGLLRAAAKFDPEREVRLATYAAYWIRAEIREYVVRAYRVVRLGTTKAERRALRAYRTARGGVSTPEGLAEASGLTVERAERLLPLLAARETSLDGASHDGASPLDRVASATVTPEDEASAHEREAIAKHAVRGALDRLTERERMIVRERIMTDDPVTLSELGARLGVSKERVRQLEERARDKLRGRLEELRELAS